MLTKVDDKQRWSKAKKKHVKTKNRTYFKGQLYSVYLLANAQI